MDTNTNNPYKVNPGSDAPSAAEPITDFFIPKRADKNLIDYVMTAIIEFAQRHNLTIRDASNYLRRYKGIDFLTDFYDVEHTLSFNDCVNDLTTVCHNNGGSIK